MSRKMKKRDDLKSQGESKYAKKIRRRARIALGFGLPAKTPFPIIWAERGVSNRGGF